MFAYIPARGGSKRIPLKNIYPISGKPMILHVIDTLNSIAELTGVAVSSDNDQIIDVVTANNGKAVVLDKRLTQYSDDKASFMDLVNYDIDRFSKKFNDSDVLFMLPTSILVNESIVREGMIKFYKNQNGLIITVVRNQQSPFLSFTYEDTGLVPLFPDYFTMPTSGLPTTFIDCGCFYIINLEKMKGKGKFLDLSPVHPVVLPSYIGIDVDTFEDLGRVEGRTLEF